MALSEQDFGMLEGKSEEVTPRQRKNDDALIRKPQTAVARNISGRTTNSNPRTEDIQDDHPKTLSSTRCLFCPSSSPTPTTNLDHMSTQHSLFVPTPSQLYSLESFLSYLAVLVYKYHECLYCGQEKGSVDAVQTHMRDKGHCMIEMAELMDFWDEEVKEEGSEDWNYKMQAETHLPSGLAINPRCSNSADETSSRAANPTLTPSQRHGLRHRNTKPAITAAESSSSQQPPATHSQPGHLSSYHTSTDPHRNFTNTPRTAKGLTGLSNQQLRTLQIVDMKMKSREESAKAKRRYASQQQPAKTVYYKTENPVYQAG
ncbi:hypothetical protein J4E83_003694 [Alternaria metachromatica]|uniref:uncharacterized protein n=1 Tax=Alternaria metachromatica TaxID=283354 RepID=UPI0020C268D3|nr:uncharacterized protein J4E83_003694 [Alternaria metachromatica]KAI4626543.1 hypothetical protein J4E83_003694 [Alternaria metachromatica]